MEDVEEIELNFDPDINNVMSRYTDLQRTLEYLKDHSLVLDTELNDYLITNILKEITHIENILVKVYDDIKGK
jgi:hypothetical protein